MLILSAHQIREMREHVVRCYPLEGCGFLLGRMTEDQKTVVRVISAQNVGKETPERRYLVDPKEFLKAENEAQAMGIDILGIYHSHPDHPSRPSEFDREHAWPVYSYVVIAVERGVCARMTSWVLDSERQFVEEAIKEEEQ